ncbi:TELO2-interacting protein 1 homolog [Zootermopsis nevadensis]|uniref:TTI1 C-terminal TPR domain-containing protein n=1 Tax=Zootermopsis nevadensis TaxID=136037 RepID=A0A067QKU2_ZOONE|nr:TELO2-interacting protein 1 homolog [Zootermopsis nevadensis]XP_021937366.1 TELO2-interacting protein 1 homolog [Zootermopsis nevadensis]KDR09792.1 hypothetical protein L798_00615 [Zootermopsis nevadensis]
MCHEINGKETEKLEFVPKIMKTSQTTVDEIINYHSCKRQSENFKNNVEVDVEDTDSGAYNESDEKNCDGEKKLPLFVEMTVSVLKRCIHFLPSKNREQKLLVLAILQEGLLILEAWENELLPIVHAIWSPFVNRFAETTDHLLVNRSFGLLCVLAQTAKDFIRSRTLKHVLLPLCQVLTKSSIESKKKDRVSSYRFTQLFKLQKELLSNMGDLVVHLNLQEREIEQVLTAAAPYLSSLQPLPLQESCVNLFYKLSGVNQGAVWLKLLCMWSPIQQLNLPADGLQTVKVTERNVDHQEFKKNVEEILHFLDIRS